MYIKKLYRELLEIYQAIVDAESAAEKIASGVHPNYTLSAKNLYRYLVLRSYDLRQYHDTLSDMGISSLRSAEGYVYSNLYHVIKNLSLVQGIPFEKEFDIEVIGYKRSKKILRKHANILFNETRKRHFTEIMVTLPEEAAENKDLVRRMVENGMEIARINLSQGNLDIWQKMIQMIKEVSTETRIPVKIYMDLAGPKIRTSRIEIMNQKGKLKDSIPIRVGEHIILTKRDTKGKTSTFGERGEQLEQAEIGVMLGTIIDDVQIDDDVYFDDGAIKAVVVDKEHDEVELVIRECYKPKLSAFKGINLPNTKLSLPSLTHYDLEMLPFICQHADLMGYSFVRRPEDVIKLYAELEKIPCKDLGVIFKIENREAFVNLPMILFEGMKRDKIGVMIARGDLAVEIGFDRISEVQNQILWLCEAAHIPVIWATQVLETLAKSGIATRAEISDAAQSAQAECVMLNKGPYILEAIKVLKNILIKMEAHTVKKKNALRALNLAKNALEKLGE